MKVLVYGYGLMGKKVAHAVMNDADLELAGVVSPVFDVQPEVPAYKSLDEVQDDIDAIIDFSHPANLDSILSYALKNKCKVVFATTGFSAEDLKKIEEASHEIALFQSYNTSYGVAMMNKMVSEFAKEFFEHHFDIEIMEKHHNQKIDSPSGTAVMLYDGINNALDDSLEPTYDRHSIHRKRERNEVGISSIRGGTIFGEHTVMFAGQDEIVEVKHTALSKEVFANGAVAALKALMNKDKGLFDLKHYIKGNGMVLQTQFADIKGNDLYIDGIKASDLAKQYGTPLYVMSEGHIRHQMNELKTKFMDKYEKALPLFASKSFSCLAIYKLASEYGIGIDCVSAGEISIALRAGFDPDKIYFHGNNKLPSEIEYALSHDVTHFVVDNFYEIENCEQIAGKLGKKVKATLRIVPGIKAGGHNYIMTGHKDTKFGFSSHYGIYLKAIQRILESDNIEYEGIHCHIGSQVFDLFAYVNAMLQFMKFVNEIYNTFGVVTSKINAGGGYGIAYTKRDEPLDFESITSEIMKVIYNEYDSHGWERPAVMIEPGRYVVGNAGITLYTVGCIKEIPDVRTYVSIDGGMSDNIRTPLYDAKYDGIVANKAGETKTKTVTVVGKICESADMITKDLPVTANIMPGDIFAVFSTGAYNYSMSSNYNQLPKPAVVFTYEGESRVVVRRQTFDDLILFDEE